MDDDHTQTRRAFAKGAAMSFGLIPRGFDAGSGQQVTAADDTDRSLGHYTQNVSDMEMRNPQIGFPLEIMWPERITTAPEFNAYDIHVGNSAFSPLKKLSDITRRISGGNFTVYEGEFQKSRARHLLNERYYAVVEEVGAFTVMGLGSTLVAIADGVALEGEYAFRDANWERITNTIEDRQTAGPAGNPAVEFEAVVSGLDTSVLATAQFDYRLSESYPTLDPLIESVTAVGQSVSPYVGEIENTTAIRFEDSADQYVDPLESILTADSTLGFQRFSESTIETTGKVATITEVQMAGNALTI